MLTAQGPPLSSRRTAWRSGQAAWTAVSPGAGPAGSLGASTAALTSLQRLPSSARAHAASSGLVGGPSSASQPAAVRHAQQVARGAKAQQAKHPGHGSAGSQHHAKQLMAAMKACRSSQALGKLLGPMLPQTCSEPRAVNTKTQQHAHASEVLNHLHISAALTHLAQLHSRREGTSDGGDGGGGRVHLTYPSSSQAAADSPGATAATAASSLAVALAVQAVQPQHLQAMQPRQVSNVVWALAKLQLASHPQCQGPWHALMSAMQAHMAHAGRSDGPGTGANSGASASAAGAAGAGAGGSPSSSTCNMQDLSNALYACALAGRPPSNRWLADWLACSQPQLCLAKPQEAANVAYALGLLGCSPAHVHASTEAGAAWVAAYLQAVQPLLPRMSGQELAMLAGALPVLLAAHSATHLQQVERQLATPVTSSAATQGTSNGGGVSGHTRSTSSYQGHGMPALQAWLGQLWDAVQTALPSMSLAELAGMMWGVSQLSQPRHDDSASPQAALQPPAGWVQGVFAAAEKALLLHGSAAVLERNSHSTDVASRDLHHMQAHASASTWSQAWSLANLMTAAAKLGYQPSSRFLEAACMAVGSQHASKSATHAQPMAHAATTILSSVQAGAAAGRVSGPSTLNALADVNALLSACVQLGVRPAPHLMRLLMDAAATGLPHATGACLIRQGR